VLADENNYTYEADLFVDVAPARALEDVAVSWEGLTRDLQGHAVDPVADITTARLIAFRDQTPEEVSASLADDSLLQSDVTLFVMCTPAAAQCKLSEFSILGSGVDVSDYFEVGSASWLLAIGRDGEPGASALLFLDPQVDGPTSVALTDDSSALVADVDLRSAPPIHVAPNDPDVSISWENLTTDGLGNPLALGSIDGVYVARYDDALSDLEEQVFDLFTMSLDTWSAPVSGHAVSLSSLSGPYAFPGVDDAGTWLLALTCSSCTNPAPRFVAVLKAGSAP
jgi:hypothetical protein